MANGFLYILTNPTIAGLAKVGKTTREPSDRIAELSSATGVPSPFILIYQQPVTDCDAAEKWVHQELSGRGWRYADNREFFSGPLHEIVAVVAKSASIVSQQLSEEATVATEENVADSAATEAERLCLLAYQILIGSNGTPAGRPRGAKLMQQAADLGCLQACQSAGEILMTGEPGVPKDLQKAFSYLSCAVKGGITECYALLAVLFMETQQTHTAYENWGRYFLYTAYQLVHLRRDHYAYQRICSHAGRNGKIYCDFVSSRRLEDIVDDAVFFVLAPYIESQYMEERARVIKFPRIAQSQQLIRLDRQVHCFDEKRARGAVLPAWTRPED
jgi:hypothetical protein